MSRRRIVVLTLAALLLAACSIGSFGNSEIEPGIVALQTKVDAFLIGLESSAGTPAAAFESHQSFYGDVLYEIAVLELSVAPQSSTAKALEALKQNLGRLETLHRAGITAVEVPVLRGLFETQFQTLLRLEGSTNRDGKEN